MPPTTTARRGTPSTASGITSAPTASARFTFRPYPRPRRSTPMPLTCGTRVSRCAALRFALRASARVAMTFLVLEDPGGPALRQAYGSWKLPEAYLIDASGTVAAVWLGSVQWSGTEVQEAIQRVLPPKKPGSPF